MSCFLSITGDLISEEILCRLSLVDIISCLSTCKRLHELITSSTNLIYLMELQMAGMVDNPHCSYEKYPRIKRLEMLREHKTRWEKLECQWRKDIRVPVRMDHGRNIMSSERHLILLPPDNQITDIRSTLLPNDPAAKVRWKKMSIGKCTFRALTALHEHDLLVCFTITHDLQTSDDARMHIHFIQLSTGGPHPQANIPILDICTYYNAKPPDIQCISIAGVHLAFMITYIDGPHDDTTFLNLWNWKSGRRLAEVAQAPESSSLFIREDLLMVLNMKCLSFDIYCISFDCAGTGDVQLIRSLLLPRLATKASLQFMTLNRLQNPIAWDPSSSFAQHGSQERPFVNDPLSALVCIELCIVQSSGYKAIYGFVAALGAFLAHSVEALDARKNAEERFRIITPIPWNLWGPQSTRWFPFRVNSTFVQVVRSPYGARCFLVRCEYGERPGPISQATLLDFDKWRVRRARSHPLVLKASCIPAGVLFSEPVVSYLPYLHKDVPRSLGSDSVKGDGNVNEFKNLWSPMRINEQEIIRILKNKVEILHFG